MPLYETLLKYAYIEMITQMIFIVNVQLRKRAKSCKKILIV